MQVRNARGDYSSFEDRYQINVDEPAGLVERTIARTDADIPWLIRQISSENATVTYAESQIRQAITLQTDQATSTVDLFWQLSGRSTIRRSGQPSRSYRAGQCNLIHTVAGEGEIQLAGPVVSTMAIQVSPDFFTRLFDSRSGSTGSDTSSALDRVAERIARGQACPLSIRPALITPAMKASLHTLLNCPYKGLVRRLFLDGKLLELMAFQLEQAEASNRPWVAGLTSSDIDKLMTVREWLDAHFLQPLTLLDVARQAGLNDFKLKKGFRTLFQTTVFSYLTDLRLTHARQLLLDENRTVSDVADALGYSQVHHFTNAFKRHFGQLPRDLKERLLADG